MPGRVAMNSSRAAANVDMDSVLMAMATAATEAAKAPTRDPTSGPTGTATDLGNGSGGGGGGGPAVPVPGQDVAEPLPAAATTEPTHGASGAVPVAAASSAAPVFAASSAAPVAAAIELANAVSGAAAAPVPAANAVPTDSDGAAAVPAQQGRRRHRLSANETEAFEIVFERKPHPSREILYALSVRFHVPLYTVRIWFQNRRQRERRMARDPSSRVVPSRASAAAATAQVLDSVREAEAGNRAAALTAAAVNGLPISMLANAASGMPIFISTQYGPMALMPVNVAASNGAPGSSGTGHLNMALPTGMGHAAGAGAGGDRNPLSAAYQEQLKQHAAAAAAAARGMRASGRDRQGAQVPPPQWPSGQVPSVFYALAHPPPREQTGVSDGRVGPVPIHWAGYARPNVVASPTGANAGSQTWQPYPSSG